jgi:serine/threonine protein kinase
MIKNVKLYDRAFSKVEKLGEGVYGKVYKVCLKDEENLKPEQRTYFALKKFERRQFEEGMDFTAIREITILKEIEHPNVVKFLDTFYGAGNLFIAYELLDRDLSYLIGSKEVSLTESVIKGLMRQFLSGLAEIHRYNVIHRDLKPQNLLLSKSGLLKIADFGFARFIASPGRDMTSGVISEWYRPPEIFFGATNYSYSVDIWSAGCIFGEFLQKFPLFYGQGEKEILTQIFYLLGVPNVKSKFIFLFNNSGYKLAWSYPTRFI